MVLLFALRTQSRVRGLKRISTESTEEYVVRTQSRVRGLKRALTIHNPTAEPSHPITGAWIETDFLYG